MHVHKKQIHNQPYIIPNKSYKPEFVRLKDQPGGQCIWQVSPTTSAWSVWDCTLSATLINWPVHVAAHSIKLSSAYSWLSLRSAFCHSQAPFDLYFQRLRDLDPSTSSVLSVYLIPACLRKANTMQIMDFVFNSSSKAMDLHNLWSKSSRGQVVAGKKVGPTAHFLSSWLGYKLENELGCPCTLLISATLRFISFGDIATVS